MKKFRKRIGCLLSEYRKALAVTGIIFILGVTLGAVCGAIIDADKLGGIESISEIEINTEDKLSVFCSAFKKNVIPFTLICFFSFSVVCIPLIFGTVFIKGFSFGFSSSILIRLFSLQGLGISIGTTMLQNLIFIPVLIGLAVYGVQNAVRLKQIRRNKDKVRKKQIFFQNIVLMCALVIIAMLCGVIESYISVNMILPIML